MKKILLICLLLFVSFASGQIQLANDMYSMFGTYNVMDFGARKDTTKNDSAAFNRAILTANAAGGGVVVVPPGNYLSSRIEMKSNVYLYSLGATIYAKSTAFGGESLIRFVGVSNAGILGMLKLNGRRAAQSIKGDAGMHLLKIQGGSHDLTFGKVVCKNAPGDGVYIGSIGATNYSITFEFLKSDSAYRNNVSLTNCMQLQIYASEVSGANGASPQTGYDFEPNVVGDSLKAIWIGSLITYNNVTSGISSLMHDTLTAQGGVTIGSIDAWGNGTGVELGSCQGITILGGNIHHNGYGVSISRNTRKIKINNVRIEKNLQRGISAPLTSQNWQSRDWDFSGCRLIDNSQQTAGSYDGIRFESDAAAYPLSYVTMYNVLAYDGQSTHTQRYGLSGGNNVTASTFRFDGSTFGNATSGMTISTVQSIKRFSVDCIYPTAAGTLNNVLKSDGTNWQSAAP